jgi:hypothetical protein
LVLRNEKNSTESALYTAVSFKPILPIYEQDVSFAASGILRISFFDFLYPKGLFIDRLATPGRQMHTVVNPALRFDAGFTLPAVAVSRDTFPRNGKASDS